MDHDPQGHAQPAGRTPAPIQTGTFYHPALDTESASTACDPSATSAPTQTPAWMSWETEPRIRRTRAWIRWYMDRTWGLTSHATTHETSLDSSALLSASSTSSVSTLVEAWPQYHRPTNHNDSSSPEGEEYTIQGTTRFGWSPSSKAFSSWIRPWCRRWRTVRRWVWIVSLVLVLFLGSNIVIVALRRGLATSLRDNIEFRQQELEHSGADGGYIPDYIPLKDHKPPQALHESHTQNEDAPADSSAQVPFSSPEVSNDTTNIGIRQGELMDVYPDEDEDEATESTSFVNWLTQAFTPFMEQTRIKNNEGPSQKGTLSAPLSLEISHEPVRYFTYKPYAGFSNQFYCMLRAMHIARRLNRTLLIPPITSSSHDLSRRNQAWSEFFDLDELQAKTGLKVIEYHDLRDKGGFRGPTGVRESGSSLGGYWVPPHLVADPNNDKRYGRPLETPPEGTSFQEDRVHSQGYQYGLGTGTGSVDMSLPCYVTCGFGTKRSLDYTAKGFMRQWGFEVKTLILPSTAMSENATDNPNLPETLQTKALPMDQTRDYDRIMQALEHETLREEPFLCITNTYKIQLPRGLDDVGIGSFEFKEFGQFLKFQPKVVQFVDEYLETILGKAPESRVLYPKDAFWASSLAPPPPTSADHLPLDSLMAPVPPPVQNSSQEPAPVLPIPPSPNSNANQGSDQDLPSASGISAPTMMVSARQEHPIRHTYFMIHIRRGDFETYCKDTFEGIKLTQCLPSNTKYVALVRELQKKARKKNIGGGNPAQIPVFVATNDNTPEKLQELRELGLQTYPGDSGEGGEEWRVLNHTEMQTMARLGPFGPMVVDQVLMAEAEAVLGVRMSTFSRVADFRQRLWYGQRILYA